uniref:translation initiation factor IF-2-like n=1 Tax=Nyctereutes procyonoides TaxID=34880 RepID=UPI002444E04E|nr:translation initiation factor IF-2-like [Nyctereutes procyonoides]
MGAAGTQEPGVLTETSGGRGGVGAVRRMAGAGMFQFPFPADTGRSEGPGGRPGGGGGGEEEEEEEEVEGRRRGRRGPGPVAPPAAPPSASPGGGAGGLGRARLRGRDRGRRVSSAQSRRRPQPAPEKGQPGGRLGACEARHGGEADEPRGPRRTAKGAGLGRPWQPLHRLGLGGLQTTFPRGPRVPRDGRGSASGAVRRRESFLWYIRAVWMPFRPFPSSALSCWSSLGFCRVRCCAGTGARVCCSVRSARSQGTEWISEEGVAAGPSGEPAVQPQSHRSPDLRRLMLTRDFEWTRSGKELAWSPVKPQGSK